MVASQFNITVGFDRKSQKALDRTINCLENVVGILNENPNNVDEIKKLLEENLKTLFKDNIKIETMREDCPEAEWPLM